MPPIPTALITAGTAGLGAATAKLFAQNSYNVVVNYVNKADRAELLVQQLKSISPLPADRQRFSAIQADLSRKAEASQLVQQAAEALGGRLDVLFSNGGWTKLRNIQDLDDNVEEDDWDRCFNLNVKSHLFLMHAARPYLDEAEGAFITTASLAGVKVSGSSLSPLPRAFRARREQRGEPVLLYHTEAYSVTKAAQIHLVKGLAIVAGPRVRVNSVSPGLMLTDWGLQFPEEQRQAMQEKTRLKRLPTVEDVADQVLCFARSRSVTGANVVIDGGLSL
ncbi:Granaticin polyketide synthase putative ketoacyl reductase 2 [Colletotrichum chlorophyti]|uniref:Granaticin polyketide synthase putative ketoacyl reductase 2 n=1 Tax=Colletotrichum chlorophyti TaxID=708187 RepID=A0A1Q8RVF5_9PEZI|nr:Granaticin polyketide synthase putative ketoacyl reductase 2 [Colletotrichum chlorophyti]